MFQQFYKDYMGFCMTYLSGTAMLVSWSNAQLLGTLQWDAIGFAATICFAYYAKKCEWLRDDEQVNWGIKPIWNALMNDKRLHR